jgi:hypothetical protein
MKILQKKISKCSAYGSDVAYSNEHKSAAAAADREVRQQQPTYKQVQMSPHIVTEVSCQPLDRWPQQLQYISLQSV